MTTRAISSEVYDSNERGIPALEELRGILKYRNLVWQLARRDILTRYKRSFLGVAWTMMNPLGIMLVMTIAFSTLFSNVPGYPAYILSGLIVWQFFSQTTTAAMVNLVWGGGLLNRIYLPRTSFAVATMITGLVNISLTLVPLFGVILFLGLPVNASIVVIPFAMLLLAAFSLGVGLFLSTMAVYFPDVAEMYQIILTAWMYLTPVFYPEEILPPNYAWLLTRLNPVYHLLRLFRISLYEARFPSFHEIWPAVVISIVVLLIGWNIFAKKSDEFTYRI